MRFIKFLVLFTSFFGPLEVINHGTMQQNNKVFASNHHVFENEKWYILDQLLRIVSAIESATKKYITFIIFAIGICKDRREKLGMTDLEHFYKIKRGAYSKCVIYGEIDALNKKKSLHESL